MDGQQGRFGHALPDQCFTPRQRLGQARRRFKFVFVVRIQNIGS